VISVLEWSRTSLAMARSPHPPGAGPNPAEAFLTSKQKGSGSSIRPDRA
jgi:hypothetical protein